MLFKSLLGYATAFVIAILVYRFVTGHLESRFSRTRERVSNWWIVSQWCSTGFLWSQWLIQSLTWQAGRSPSPGTSGTAAVARCPAWCSSTSPRSSPAWR